LLGAVLYSFPSKKIKVIAVTGTKGKSTTVEMINSIFEEAGYKTAVASTIRFKIDKESNRNLFKMTMPGRFTIQKFISEAALAKCDFAIIEMTSEGAKQFRHKFIYLDALLFTNISPEHIESHGSYEKYLEAKLKIAKALKDSPKKDKWLVVNEDDVESEKFVKEALGVRMFSYGIKNAEPLSVEESFSKFNLLGQEITSHLPGLFNIYNMLGAGMIAKCFDIDPKTIKSGLEKIKTIKGRVEKIEEGQSFEIIVDYAHTIDSLEKLYGAFPNKNKICVLGNTGGGRDKWKRKGMAEVAEKNCSHIILTNEDPYDEDPKKILSEMAEGIKDKSKLQIIMDRRMAINKALLMANEGENRKNIAVLISGKGTDPYIMAENGKKIPWSDEEVAREEIRKIIKTK